MYSLILSAMSVSIYSLLGQLGLGLFRVKSQYLGLMDMPKLWYLRFPPLDTWSINGFSPLDNVLDL